MRLSAELRRSKGMAIRDNKEGYVQSRTNNVVMVERVPALAIRRLGPRAARGVP
jgi:hypothetical protein